MFKFRLEQQAGLPRLMQRTIIPDGVSTVLNVDFNEDFQKLNIFGAVAVTDIFDVGGAKGQGTGADATDEKGRLIPYTVSLVANEEVSWTFETPPQNIFWVWVQFLVQDTKRMLMKETRET